jgi:Nitrate reductase delta subunit
MTAEPELFRALGALCEPPAPAHRAIADALALPAVPDGAEQTDLFVLQLVPYAAAYLSPDGMLGGEVADRVAGFWRVLRTAPPVEPDHLAALLGLYAALGEAEADASDRVRAAARQARGALLWEHVLTWAPPFAHAVQRTGSPFHAAWAGLLDDALRTDAAAIPPPPALPLHLRDVPAPPAPHLGRDHLVRAILTPVRSGLILTRADLAGCARQAGLGLRAGTRAFALRSMLDQEPASVLDTLAALAGEWAAWHHLNEPLLGQAARHWRSRAEATGAALHQLHRTAQEVLAHG